MEPSAKVILDSISPEGDRLTTIEAVMHRFVLAEFNTHRVFSRNSASSRAIPVTKQMDKVANDPAFPIAWPSEKPGMSGGAELEGIDLSDAQDLFKKVQSQTVGAIQEYLDSHEDKAGRLHKSLLNRLLEPFMWHTVIVSSTDWDGFWDQRCSPLAQPELRETAEAMRDAFDRSSPTIVEYGEWHMPYLREEDHLWAASQAIPQTRLCQISVARCARVSYLTHDGNRDPREDVEMYGRLVTADPPHASPLEHVATPSKSRNTLGNLTGWAQLRHCALP